MATFNEIAEAGEGVIRELAEYDLSPMDEIRVLVAVLEALVKSVDALYNLEMKSKKEFAKSFIGILKEMGGDDDE